MFCQWNRWLLFKYVFAHFAFFPLCTNEVARLAIPTASPSSKQIVPSGAFYSLP